jgi:hypothetical protein
MTISPLRRGWVKFPNIFLDLYMPRLTDTEWRVLCVVVRQTLGWDRDKRRKRDWLSHGQMKRRTGRQSAAISGAIARLCEQGLLVVTDRGGNRLSLATERRRSQTKLYYHLPYVLIGENRFSDSENNNKYPNKRIY